MYRIVPLGLMITVHKAYSHCDILQRLHVHLLLGYDTVYISCVIAYIYSCLYYCCTECTFSCDIGKGISMSVLLLCEEGTFFSCIMAVPNFGIITLYIMSDIITFIGYRQCIFRSGFIIVCRVHIYSLYYYSTYIWYYYPYRVYGYA